MTVLRPGQKSRENNRLVTWACALAVAIVAVVLRIPYCYESFWIDELHTAWAVWAEFDKVTDRAAAGNQTPLYFHGVWLWKAVFGPSEFALRMSSGNVGRGGTVSPGAEACHRAAVGWVDRRCDSDR